MCPLVGIIMVTMLSNRIVGIQSSWVFVHEEAVSLRSAAPDIDRTVSTGSDLAASKGSLGERKIVDDIGIELSTVLELVLEDSRREPTAPLPSRNEGGST